LPINLYPSTHPTTTTTLSITTSFASISIIPAPNFFFSMIPPPPTSTLFPYTTLFRSIHSPCREPSRCCIPSCRWYMQLDVNQARSEEHTSELQSRGHLVCRLLLEKKKR